MHLIRRAVLTTFLILAFTSPVSIPILVVSLAAPVAADDPPATPASETAAADRLDPVLYPDADSVTEHEIVKNGETIRYRATAGTLPLFK